MRRAATILLLPIALFTIKAAEIGASRHATHSALELHGAETIRMPEDRTDTLRIVTANLKLHAGTVFSFPGLYSFNIWSEKPTPTLANTTHWFSLLDNTRQREIIQALQADATACIVVQNILLDYMKKNGVATHCLLRDHLMEAYTPALQVEGYAIWARKGRVLQPINLVEMAQTGPGPRLRIQGAVLDLRAPIRTIELMHYDGHPPVIQIIDVRTPTVAFSTFNQAVPGKTDSHITLFSVEFQAAFAHHNPRESFVVLRAADGRVLERLRFSY